MIPSRLEEPSKPWTKILLSAALSYPGRLTFYGVSAFILCQVLFVAMRDHGVGTFTAENGPVEQSQAIMATFACVCLFAAAWKMKVGRTGLILCATMVGYAAARECDTLFETLLFEDAYKYVVGLPLALVGFIAFWLGRKVVFQEALQLVRTPAITIFAIAGIYICTVCQILDRPDLWTGLGESPQAEATKAAVEEFAELFGYLLLAFSGIEAIALAFSPKHRLTNEVTLSQVDGATGDNESEYRRAA